MTGKPCSGLLSGFYATSRCVAGTSNRRSIVKSEKQDNSESRKTIIVDVSPEEVGAEEDRIVKEFQREAKVPGFRPGKAPENMLRKRFSGKIAEELKSRIIRKAYEEQVAKQPFRIYAAVDVKEGEIRTDSGARIQFTLDVIPDFELPQYKGLKVTNEPTEVTEDEVEQTLQNLLNQRAQYNVADKAAEKGDYVRCSYEGTIDGERIADLAPDSPIYGTQEMTWEEAGAENSPGVRAVTDALVGMKAGDEAEVSMEFPGDFEPEALAGKTGVYSVKVEEVREKVLPEMDQAFFDGFQVKDEAELRERIRESLQQEKERRNTSSEREQITNQLGRAVDIEVPESGVEAETDRILRDFMQRNMQQGVSSGELEENKEQLYDGARAAARDRIKVRTILQRIAEEEEIGAENEDLSRVIMQEAAQSGKKPDNLVKELKKDRDRLNAMREDIVLGKVMDHLVDQAEREVVERSSEAVEAQ